MKSKLQKRIIRKNRIRAKISGTAARPRLSIFRSNRYVSAELIDDVARKTMASVSTRSISKKMTPKEKAKEAGNEMAKVAKSKGIASAVFDRGGYLYSGKVKEFAEGVREGGILM